MTRSGIPTTKSSWTIKGCDVCRSDLDPEILEDCTYDLHTRKKTFAFRMQNALCAGCGFVFGRLIPEDGFLSEYYRDAHILHSKHECVEPDFDGAARLRQLTEVLPLGSSILEVGASSGEFCATLRKAGYVVGGLDPLQSETNTSVEERALADGTSSPGPLQDRKVDAVVSYFVLEHVTRPRQWLREIAALIKDNGIVIIEVPDYESHPLQSLHREHFLHFTPFHLRLLMESEAFVTESVGSEHASRIFGTVYVGRKGRGRPIDSPGVAVSMSEEGRAERVSSSRQCYRKAEAIREEERFYARAVAGKIKAMIDARPEGKTRVCFWAANEYATSIVEELASGGYNDSIIIDNAASKVGNWHDGFVREIQPPELPSKDAAHRILVLCSPAWNPDIEKQIRKMNLQDVTILHGAGPKREIEA